MGLQQGIAQSINSAKLDSLFSLLEEKNKFMGSIALYKEGHLLYSNAVGQVDGTNDRKPDRNTDYRIGSITKTFTSVLILQAVEKGKLRLEDTLSKWYPQVKNAGRITIRQMLTHQSGIGWRQSIFIEPDIVFETCAAMATQLQSPTRNTG